MKSCVVTANYACDPNKVWLYLTKPTLNGWRRDVSSYEESDDGLKAAEKNTDGSETQIDPRAGEPSGASGEARQILPAVHAAIS